MIERDRQKRYDAPLVPEGFNPATDLDENHEVRACKVCGVEYIETLLSRRIFCSYRCKSRAGAIRHYLRENGYEPVLEDYVKNPLAFPPINPLKKKGTRGQPIGKDPLPGREIPENRGGNATRAVLARRAAEADAARASRAKSQAKIAEINLSTRRLKAEDDKKTAAQRDAIAKAAEAINLIPLADQPDVLTGKVLKISETEVDQIRSCITTVVTNNIAIAEQVLLGTVVWSPSQTTLFAKLLNKVLPDIAARVTSVSSRDKPIGELTVEELESMVTKSKEIPHVQTVND